MNRSHAAQPGPFMTLPSLHDALAKSPTLPPLAAPDAPSLKQTAAFVGTLLTAGSALAWLILPRVL